MGEQAQALEIRRRRSSAEVEQLVSEYEGSGMGRVEFCREHGLSVSTLARYRKRRAQAGSSTAGGWVAVEVSGGGAGLGTGKASGLAVVLSSGRRIEIGRGFDARTLMQLLSVLERV
jgi:hypothetical protein